MISVKDIKRHVLLMYITKESGHHQATIAIHHALKEIDPTVEAPTINGFEYTYPILERVVKQTYLVVIKRTPKVWDFVYDNPTIVQNTSSLKNFLYKTSHKKIAELLAQYRPDTVVCTQAFPCGMVAEYKCAHNVPIKLLGVLTDFEPHSFWVNEGVDYYIVPTIEAKERMVTMGVRSDSIKIFGIPIKSKFAIQRDKEQICAKLGLDADKPTLLVMGGGQGLGPIKNIVKELVEMPMHFQVIILTGNNKKIVNSLRQIERKSDKKILVFEFTPNVDEFMEISTLIITKPGGITTAESLAKGLPMLIINPIPGQESRNTDFMIKQGVAVRIQDAREIRHEVTLLLKSSERLANMRCAAFQKARPLASLDIARLILHSSDGGTGHRYV